MKSAVKMLKWPLQVYKTKYLLKQASLVPERLHHMCEDKIFFNDAQKQQCDKIAIYNENHFWQPPSQP
jgi:hypothetical protein